MTQRVNEKPSMFQTFDIINGEVQKINNAKERQPKTVAKLPLQRVEGSSVKAFRSSTFDFSFDLICKCEDFVGR